MPEFKSDTYTAQEDAQNNAGKIIGDAALISGKPQYIQCAVTVPAGTAADDTILLGFIPSGATILPGISSVTVAITGGDETVDLALEDATVIAAAVSVADVGSAPLNSAVPNAKTGTRQALVGTLSGALTAGGEIYFNIAYVFAE